MRRPEPTLSENEHVRMLSCVAASLLLAIVAVKFWPLPDGDGELADLYSSTGQEVIEIAEVIPTRQEKRQPPPPAPLPPIEVADEDLIEFVDLELDSPITSTDVSEDDIILEGTEDESAPLPRSQTQAKLVRFAPPRYPDEAKRRKIRAEILVEVDVDELGVVRHARIVRRYLLGKDENDKELVPSLGYGLEESAVEAAMASQYRPARENGQAVRSLMEFYVTFGTG